MADAPGPRLPMALLYRTHPSSQHRARVHPGPEPAFREVGCVSSDSWRRPDRSQVRLWHRSTTFRNRLFRYERAWLLPQGPPTGLSHGLLLGWVPAWPSMWGGLWGAAGPMVPRGRKTMSSQRGGGREAPQAP